LSYQFIPFSGKFIDRFFEARLLPLKCSYIFANINPLGGRSIPFRYFCVRARYGRVG